MKRALAVAAYAVALVLWSWLVGIPNDPIGIALWLWLLAICWRLDWSWQFPKDWWPWLAALAFYGLARGVTDDWGFTPHEVWPIRADEWLAQLWGGDVVPTVSLQHRLCADHCAGFEELRWWDYLASATYASHFVAGLTIAGVLWIRDRGEWLRWIRRYVTISYLALATKSYQRRSSNPAQWSAHRCRWRLVVGTVLPPHSRASHSSACTGQTSCGVKPQSSVTPRASP